MPKSKKEKEFERKLNELIERADKLLDDEVTKVIAMLEEARKGVAATVASTEWEAHYLQQMKAAIERALQEFGDKYGVELREAQRAFWELGIDIVDLPIREVGVMAAIPEIDTAVLGIMQGFSSDLVTNLSADAIKRITNELTLAMLGQKTPYEVMELIGRNLDDKSIFSSIADRAEAITRTEGGRVLSAATQARHEAAAKVVPGLMKEWRHSHISRMPRIAHLAAEGQRVKVNERFMVAGEALKYPRDPAGSAKNTIRCECYSVPYHPNWDAVLLAA